jgi:hypothetical protein
MAGEDNLAQLFDAWRDDIDSEPFPVFSVTTLAAPRYRRQARGDGRRGFSEFYAALRTSRRAKAR